jgi:hypothetical protein
MFREERETMHLTEEERRAQERRAVEYAARVGFVGYDTAYEVPAYEMSMRGYLAIEHLLPFGITYCVTAKGRAYLSNNAEPSGD